MVTPVVCPYKEGADAAILGALSLNRIFVFVRSECLVVYVSCHNAKTAFLQLRGNILMQAVLPSLMYMCRAFTCKDSYLEQTSVCLLALNLNLQILRYGVMLCDCKQTLNCTCTGRQLDRVPLRKWR